MFSRRELLRNSAMTGVGLAVGSGLSALVAADIASAMPAGGYGPLVADPAGLLDLPPGFSYKVVARSQAWSTVTGAKAAPPTNYTGTTVASADNPDGTGSFARPGGGTILVRNSELSGLPSIAGAVPHAHLGNPVPTYDPDQRGGTSTLEIDSANNLVSITPSIAGTYSNCAGGVTPWGTWLTCEENESLSGTYQHGYVFEVDPLGTKTVAEPITGMGRFAHEAVCIDPATGIAYLSEDANTPLGLMYRFVPTDTSGAYGSLRAGGTLTAMRCTKSVGGSPVVVRNLAEATIVGTVYDVTWVPVPIPDPAGALTAAAGPSQKVRNQFADADITRSKKFEGVWFGEGKVWINCSFAKEATPGPSPDLVDGGVAHEGQVWLYDPAASTLTLKVRLAPGGTFDGPDNIVVSPYGGAFLCEDGDGDQYVVGIGSDDVPFAFAKNQIEFPTPGDFQEFTGACFSPDGSTLFFNTQVPGITYAVTGPWNTLPPDVPEMPKAILASLTAAGLLAGAVALRNRGGRSEEPEPSPA